MVTVGRLGPDHHDRGVRGVDLGEQSPHEPIGVAQRAVEHARRLLGGRRGGCDRGAHQVGTFHQHHRAVVPRVAEARQHRVGVETHAEWRGDVRHQKAMIHLATRDAPLTRHQRRDRGATVERHPHHRRPRIGAVTVRDDRPTHAFRRQRIPQRTDLGAVELRIVLVDHVGDGEVHQPVAGRGARARAEHDARGVAAERFVHAESLARRGLRSHCTRAGAEGHVTAGGVARSEHPVGDHAPDGRRREQPPQVGKVGGGDVRPVDVGQREHQHARHRGA